MCQFSFPGVTDTPQFESTTVALAFSCLDNGSTAMLHVAGAPAHEVCVVSLLALVDDGSGMSQHTSRHATPLCISASFQLPVACRPCILNA
jgi:hypothetical protein